MNTDTDNCHELARPDINNPLGLHPCHCHRARDAADGVLKNLVEHFGDLAMDAMGEESHDRAILTTAAAMSVADFRFREAYYYIEEFEEALQGEREDKARAEKRAGEAHEAHPSTTCGNFAAATPQEGKR